jgi:hypothetical protein
MTQVAGALHLLQALSMKTLMENQLIVKQLKMRLVRKNNSVKLLLSLKKIRQGLMRYLWISTYFN